MQDTINSKNTASSESISITPDALKNLVLCLNSAKNNDWELSIKNTSGIPEPLLTAIKNFATMARLDIEDKDKQLQAFGLANNRIVFLNEAVNRWKKTEIGAFRADSKKTLKQYKKSLKDLSFATGANHVGIIFLDDNDCIESIIMEGVDLDENKYINQCSLEIKGLLGKILTSQEIIKTNRINEPKKDHSFISYFSNIISVPLIIKRIKKIKGAIILANKKDSELFDENDAMICDLFASEIISLLEIKLLTEQINKYKDERSIILEKKQDTKEQLLQSEEIASIGQLISSEITNLLENNLLTKQIKKDKDEQSVLLEKIQDAKERLLQSEKMASIGQLAAGVAHEINNPIGYINSNIKILHGYIKNLFKLIEFYENTEQELSEEIKSRLTKVKDKLDIEYIKEDIIYLVNESVEGITRVKKIVMDLKNFSHADNEELSLADIHIGIDSALNIVHNEIKYKSEIIKEYGDIPKVWCLVSQLNQVILNMLVNASHAIEDKGIITISTGCDDKNVWIKICDTGKGIAEENLQKIFDPFYTTKEIGKGTGLGLSLSYGIIEKHNGEIKVKSELGKGTEFKIIIPIERIKST